jgi:hypothetical protein
VAKTTAQQRLIFKVRALILHSELLIFFKIFEFHLVTQSLLMTEGPGEIFVNTYSAMKAYQTDTSGFQEFIRPLHIINAQSTLRNLECAPWEALYFRADARDAKS